MYCEKCGKMIDDTAVSCPWCGAAVSVKVKADLAAEKGRQKGPENKAEPDPTRIHREMRARQMTGVGITVALFAALIYWSGLIDSMPVITVLLAGYVLLEEKDQWLRAVALKAITIIVCFALLLGFVNLLTYFKDAMTHIINMLLTTAASNGGARQVTGEFFTELLDILRNIILFVRDLYLILCGFMALQYKNMRVPVVDDLVNRHIGRLSGSPREG